MDLYSVYNIKILCVHVCLIMDEWLHDANLIRQLHTPTVGLYMLR